MNRAIIGLIFLLFFSVEAYSQNNDTYSRLELIADTDNRGIGFFHRLTGITNEVRVLESGWVDLSGSYAAPEFYIKYYIEIEERETINIMILSAEGDGVILYHNRWDIGVEGFGVSFFQRNQTPFMLLTYIAGAGSPVYTESAIFEYTEGTLLFSNFNMIYTWVGWFELIDGNFIIYNKTGRNILNFNDGVFELIESNE